jgi:hypothetical protein
MQTFLVHIYYKGKPFRWVEMEDNQPGNRRVGTAARMLVRKEIKGSVLKDIVVMEMADIKLCYLTGAPKSGWQCIELSANYKPGYGTRAEVK